jgi:acetyl-CoA carboxylase biotin carboxyl carrier protein
MDLDAIKRLLALMADNDLVELELEEEGRKVRLRKGGDHAPVPPHVVLAGNGAVSGSPPPAPSEAGPVVVPKRPGVVEIRSPLVGTFYSAAKPGADPFVNVGDAVNPDKVVCIVEAMKVMNEIKAEVTGKIVELLAKNGQPVEFNEPLMLVQKTD